MSEMSEITLWYLMVLGTFLSIVRIVVNSRPRK